MPADWRRTQKYDWLEETAHMDKIAKKDWSKIIPDKKHNWLQSGLREDLNAPMLFVVIFEFVINMILRACF